MARSQRDLSEDVIVGRASDLIAIASENPPGAAYDECLARIGAELEALAIDYALVETGEEPLRRQAIVAVVGDGGPLLYLHGHYDVVPALDRDQFRPRVVDGRLDRAWVRRT